jgi:hypothetical protein
MGFKAGIVGLPNVGKSTLFNALTRTAAAQAANYPFCTIEPNVGDVAMPEPRLDVLAKIALFGGLAPGTLGRVAEKSKNPSGSTWAKGSASHRSCSQRTWSRRLAKIMTLRASGSRSRLSSTSPSRQKLRWRVLLQPASAPGGKGRRVALHLLAEQRDEQFPIHPSSTRCRIALGQMPDVSE